MRFIGNLIWFLFGGLICGLLWAGLGILWCVTIVGIPFGIQCFKLAGLSFAPFGKRIEPGSGVGNFLANILWLFLSGIEMAAVYAALSLLFFITIIGIPFGKQCFKLVELSLMPFGASVL